jgi:murein DD-endopeptidase MepM/ murein hydrolase activator NlpD
MTPAARRRTVAFLAAAPLVVAGVLAVAPAGSADELDERKHRVESQIDSAEQELHHSTAELKDAGERLLRAEGSLTVARATLAQTRGELVAAEALDKRMQVELAEAVGDLKAARAALAYSEAKVSRREDAVRAVVVQQNESGGTGLMTISTVLSTQDTVDLTQKLTSYESVLNAQAATLARLAASRVTQEVQESTFEELRRDVAAKRAAAAANLREKAELEARATETAAEIKSLVKDRAEARAAAADAKAEDQRLLQQLETEKASIGELLRQRAEEARRAAAAAAAAAAEEAAARAEAAAREEAAKGGGASDPPAGQPAAPAPPAPTDSSGLSSPVAGYLTSPYGMRFHPIYQVWKLHDGTDFGAACGTPVRAAADGTVISRYYNSGYGNRIIIDHGLRSGVGLGTTYNHLSGYAASVGQQVQRGQVIGYVGTTGASTGCHLHFMVFENGATVDPMKWL